MFEKYLEMPAAKWLRLIENDSLRTKAISHTMNHPGNPDLLCSNVSEALFHAFDWENTEEGEFYWLNVYNSRIRLKESELAVATAKIKRLDVMILAAITFTIGIASLWMF